MLIVIVYFCYTILETSVVDPDSLDPANLVNPDPDPGLKKQFKIEYKWTF